GSGRRNSTGLVGVACILPIQEQVRAKTSQGSWKSAGARRGLGSDRHDRENQKTADRGETRREKTDCGEQKENRQCHGRVDQARTARAVPTGGTFRRSRQARHFCRIDWWYKAENVPSAATRARQAEKTPLKRWFAPRVAPARSRGSS